jgi:hypothetical protein
MTTQRIITGDCIEGLRTLPDASVHCCPTPAAWCDQQGRCWCSSHLPTNGTFRSMRRAEPDIVERLLSQERQPGDSCDSAECDTVKELAAAEIRRLRAALAGHASGDGKQQRHGREEG